MIPSIYTSDWYNRSNTDYVLTNTDLAIGFVKIPNKQYSRFLYNEDKIERLCADEYLIKKEMKDLLKSMGLTNIGFKLSKTNDTASTNGRYIEVGLGKPSTDVDSSYDKIDRIIGMTIHESCHCLYTDFNYVSSVITVHPPLVHHIHNVLEDELIEEKICNKFPGYSNFLSKLKYQVFEESKEDENNMTGDLADVLEILFYIVRYPKYLCTIDINILNKHESLFKKIKNIMIDNDCFNIKNEYITRSTTGAAIQIYELIKNMTAESKEEGKSNNKNSSECNSSNKNDSDDPNDVEVEVRDNPNEIDENKLTEGEGNGIIGVMNTVYDKINSTSEATTPKKLIVYHDKISNTPDIDDELDHEIPSLRMKISNDIKISTHENRYAYNKYLNSVKNYINVARKLIVPNSTSYEIVTNRFRRNGSLDPNRLVNAMCNEQTVYIQKEQIIKSNSPEYALVFAIDESGSMDYDKLNILASNFVIMIYEALKNYPKIKIFVYGHGDCVYKYLDPFTLKSKYTLGDRNRQCGQNEELSYKIIVDDVKNYTKLPIIVFNITDSCYISNTTGINEVIKELREDATQPAYFNLITLGHNTGLNSKVAKWNNELYGEGNWVIYNRSTISQDIKILIDNFSQIIRKNFK